MSDVKQQFIQALEASIHDETFVKVTLSKPHPKGSALKNLYVRLVLLKKVLHLSFTYHYTTQDTVENYPISQGIEQLQGLLGGDFLHGRLFTTNGDVELRFNKKRKGFLRSTKASYTARPSTAHDREKKRYIHTENNLYLQRLGILTSNNRLAKDKQHKFRQINKYIEIIDSLLRPLQLPKPLHIADMGSGKGYLTFALYDYLHHQLKLHPVITGIELREHLVQQCNTIAQEANYEHLHFEAQSIQEFATEKLDILIALHACNTATDDAIAKGIQAGAQLIICAPCCHQQIRPQLQASNELNTILKYGILKERQAEILTDTIRALLLEIHGYQTKVFEFIATEHTGKNIMIVGQKSAKSSNPAHLKAQLDALKNRFGIQEHYLEQLLMV